MRFTTRRHLSVPFIPGEDLSVETKKLLMSLLSSMVLVVFALTPQILEIKIDIKKSVSDNNDGVYKMEIAFTLLDVNMKVFY